MDYNKSGIGTNKSIIELYNMMKSGQLVLQPAFQRRLVWNNAHKEAFLETIILGYPFPEIYFADGEIDLERLEKKILVVDGQQRLNTIYQYITGDPELILKRIKPYSQLENKEVFLGYTVVVRDLKDTGLDEIKEIFKRINSVSYALNAMEINNALYDGEFIKIAKKIAETRSFKECLRLDDGATSRMKDIEFVLLVMTTCELGDYFSNNKEVEGYIRRYNDEYPSGGRTKDKLLMIFRFINELDIGLDSLWRSRNGLFTLICELAFCMDSLALDKKIVEEALRDIEEGVKEENPEAEYASFYLYLFQGTGSKKARRVRGDFLRKKLHSVIQRADAY